MSLQNGVKTVINGISFSGYSSYDVVNSLTYVVSPQRSNSGSMPGINDIDTFTVATIQITYNLMPYEKYKEFIAAVSNANQFVVEYYDADTDSEKVGYFYLAPLTKKQIMYKNKSIYGIRDFTIELISTNNEV